MRRALLAAAGERFGRRLRALTSDELVSVVDLVLVEHLAEARECGLGLVREREVVPLRGRLEDAVSRELRQRRVRARRFVGESDADELAASAVGAGLEG